MPHDPWPRPLFVPGGGETVLSFVVYAPALLTWDFTLPAEGSPVAALPAGVEVHLYAREATPEFAEWADALAADPAAPHAAALATAGVWYEVGGRAPSTADLTAVQAAWALVRVLCRAGGLAVWDGVAMRWTAAADALAADPGHPGLAAACGVELAEVERHGLVAVHTLGMPKFGRRDLIAFGTAENATLLGGLLQGLALDLIEGAVLASGDEVAKGGLRLRAEGYAPGFNGPEVAVPFCEQPLVLVPLE